MWLFITGLTALLLAATVILFTMLLVRHGRARRRAARREDRRRRYHRLVDAVVAGEPESELPVPRVARDDAEVIEAMLQDKVSYLAGEDHAAVARVLDRLGFLDHEIGRLDHPDPAERARAAEAVGEFRLMKGADPLKALLGDPEPFVSETAARALGKVLAASRDIADSLVSELTRELRSPNRWLLLNTAEIVRNLGESGTRELVAAIGSGEAPVRAHAAAIAGELRHPATAEPLLRCLGDEDDASCAAALLALAKLGDARAVEPALRLLDGPRDAVRVAAAESLGRLGDPRAVAALRRAAERGPSEVTAEAVTALARIRHDDSFRAIDELVKAGDHRFRLAIAEALELGGLVDTFLSDATGSDRQIRFRAEAIITQLVEAGAVGPVSLGLSRGTIEQRARVAVIVERTLASLLVALQGGDAGRQARSLEVARRLAASGLRATLEHLLRGDTDALPPAQDGDERRFVDEARLAAAEAVHALRLLEEAATALAESGRDESLRTLARDTALALTS